MVDDLRACLYQSDQIAAYADLSTQIGSYVGCTTQVSATCNLQVTPRKQLRSVPPPAMLNALQYNYIHMET